jgi:hypothetical protein
LGDFDFDLEEIRFKRLLHSMKLERKLARGTLPWRASGGGQPALEVLKSNPRKEGKKEEPELQDGSNPSQLP